MRVMIVSRHAVRGGYGAMAGSLGALVLLLGLFSASCDHEGGTKPAPEAALQASEPLLYDGSFHEPIGPFHITDLRSKMVPAGSDSIDLYAEMVDYETRNLTVFRRSGATGRPVIFFIHGGAWIDEYREWYSFVAESFTVAEGFVTVVINYRLASREVFPAGLCPTKESPAPDSSQKAASYPDNIRDCADALQWTIDNVAEYGGDPQQIFVFGHSAGGHLASLLITHPDFAALRPHVRGVISMSGAYSLEELNLLTFADALDQTFHTHSDEAILSEASPVTYVDDQTALPPFLVLYAEEELPSLTSQALAFSARLRESGHEVASQHLAGYGHVSEMTAFAYAHETPTVLVLQFIGEHLP